MVKLIFYFKRQNIFFKLNNNTYFSSFFEGSILPELKNRVSSGSRVNVYSIVNLHGTQKFQSGKFSSQLPKKRKTNSPKPRVFDYILIMMTCHYQFFVRKNNVLGKELSLLSFLRVLEKSC